MINIVDYWNNNKDDKEFAIEMIQIFISINLSYCDEFVFSRHELAMETINNLKLKLNKQEYKKFVSIIGEHNYQSFPWKFDEYLKSENYEIKTKQKN